VRKRLLVHKYAISNVSVSVNLPQWMNLLSETISTEGLYCSELRQFSWLLQWDLHPGQTRSLSATFCLEQGVSDTMMKETVISARVEGDAVDQLSISMLKTDVRRCAVPVRIFPKLRIVQRHKWHAVRKPQPDSDIPT